LENAKTVLEQNFNNYIQVEDEKQNKAFDEYGVIFGKLFQLITTCWYHMCEATISALSRLISFIFW